jgi:hypothetical protein
LRLELDDGNRAKIRARMAKIARTLATKQRKLQRIQIRIEKFRMKRARVQKLIAQYRLSWDLKKKKQLDDENKQLEADIEAEEGEEAQAIAEEVEAQEAATEDEATSAAELKAIDDAELDDKVVEEAA